MFSVLYLSFQTKMSLPKGSFSCSSDFISSSSPPIPVRIFLPPDKYNCDQTLKGKYKSAL